MDGTKKQNNSNKAIEGIEEKLADAITGRPHDFTVGGATYYLWPLTLGKHLLLKPYFESLGIGTSVPDGDPSGVVSTLLKKVRERRADCAMMLSILTMDNSRTAFFDLPLRRERAGFFERELTDSDLGHLLVTGMTSTHTHELVVHLGLDRERERLSETLRAKADSRNSMQFGSISLLGAFIYPLMEMGFTYDEIVYERDYSLMQLMLLDKPVSVYLSDDEVENLTGSVGALIDGDSENADQQLLAFFGAKGISRAEGNPRRTVAVRPDGDPSGVVAGK
jgi:hypothetical protein